LITFESITLIAAPFVCKTGIVPQSTRLTAAGFRSNIASMAVRTDSSRSLPFLDAFSARDRSAVEAALARHAEARQKRFEARDREAAKVVADYRTRIRTLLGDEKFDAFRNALRRERLSFRDLWQPPLKPGRDDRGENAARKRNVDAVLRELGGDAARVRAASRDLDARIASLPAFDRTVSVPGYSMPHHYDRWAKLSALNHLPLPWGVLAPDDSDPHRWFVFRPPFFGFNFQFASSCSRGFTPDRIHFVDPPAGLIGYRAMLTSHDEREFEVGELILLSAIAFGFEAPVAGLVEVLVDAQCALARHHVKMDDDWGWSDSLTTQENSLSIDVLGENTLPGTTALMSDFRAEFDGDDETVDRTYLVPGQHYFAQALSSGPVAAGRSVVVQIGTLGHDFSKLNDVGIKSESHFRWFVSSVQVRIAP
jgi:hypothetical protein